MIFKDQTMTISHYIDVALWVRYCTLWENFSWYISDCNNINILYSSFSESLKSKYQRVICKSEYSWANNDHFPTILLYAMVMLIISNGRMTLWYLWLMEFNLLLLQFHVHHLIIWIHLTQFNYIWRRFDAISTRVELVIL